jgi:hypothetical protein
MIDMIWLASVGAGAICFGAGMLGWMKSPASRPAGIFMLAMAFLFVACVTGPLYPLINQANIDTADTIAKVFAVSILLAETFMWELAIAFPVERKISFRPPNLWGLLMIAAPASAIVLGSLVEPDFSSSSSLGLSRLSIQIIVGGAGATMVMAMLLSLTSWRKATLDQRRSAMIYLVGLWALAISCIPYLLKATGGPESSHLTSSLATTSITAGVAIAGLIFAYTIVRGQMNIVSQPKPEAMASSAKASYRLLHRRVYLVEEEKPSFSFKLFTDILKGRCYDCENDQSFPCESLECSTCKLPCPCRGCTKYKSRPQGLIITRTYPRELRSKFFIQTTPIIWLSSVAGKDNMDPAKLTMLTDYLINFMERSNNAVVLVDGIEYLVTSNDFTRVLKAIDRWTESAMTSTSRLIMSIDPRAFENRETALMENSREVVRPDAPKAWQVIPEKI